MQVGKFLKLFKKNSSKNKSSDNDISFSGALSLENTGKSKEAFEVFVKTFVESFCESEPLEKKGEVLNTLKLNSTSRLAAFSLYLINLKNDNDMDETINLCIERIEEIYSTYKSQIESESDSKLKQKVFGKFVNELEFYLEIYLQADIWNKDFAKNAIELPIAGEILNFCVENDIAGKQLRVCGKLLRALFESHDFENSMLMAEKVVSSFAKDYKTHLAIINLLHNLPKRALHLSKEKELDAFRKKVANSYYDRLRTNGLYGDQADCYKIAREPSVSDTIAISNFFSGQIEQGTSSKIVNNLIHSGRLDEHLRIGKYFNILMKDDLHHLSEAYQDIVSGRANVQLFPAVYRELTDRGRYKDALEVLEMGPSEVINNLAYHFKNCCNTRNYELFFKLSRQYLESSNQLKALNPGSFNALEKFFQYWHDMSFIKEINKLNQKVPQGDGSKGVLATFVGGARALRTLPLPMLLEAKKNGWKIVHLDNQFIYEPESPANSEGAMNRYVSSKRGLNHDWHIDFENEEAIVDGINCWQGIYEHLSIGLRRYHMDYDSIKVKREFNYRQRNSDLGLSAVKDFLGEFSASNQPKRILLGDVHTTPGHTIRSYCESHRVNGNVQIVNYKNAYENLHRKKDAEYSTKMAVENVSAENLNYARLGSPKGFAEWDKAFRLSSEAIQIGGKPTGSDLSHEQEKFIKELKEFKSQGGKVYCLIGKVIFDLIEPVKSGLVHSSLKDWMNHTIKTVSKNEKIKLLVKPHPHELSNAIALFGAESLKDLIEEKSNNMIYLEPKFIGLNHLTDLIDLGILWSGSSCLDLATANIPLVVASKYANTEIPIGLKEPSSLGEYEEILVSGKVDSDTNEISRKAHSYYNYLHSDKVSCPFRFTLRPSTNKNLWPMRYEAEDFEEYFKVGNPHVETMYSRLL